MKLLADENVRRRLVKALLSDGHNVKEAVKGAEDSALFSLAKKEKRILLTNDTDFSNEELYSLDKTVGIIVFRVFPDTLSNQKRALLRLLIKYEEAELFGSTVELTKDGETFAK